MIDETIVVVMTVVTIDEMIVVDMIEGMITDTAEKDAVTTSEEGEGIIVVMIAAVGTAPRLPRTIARGDAPSRKFPIDPIYVARKGVDQSFNYRHEQSQLNRTHRLNNRPEPPVATHSAQQRQWTPRPRRKRLNKN